MYVLCPLAPLSHGPLNPDSRSGSNLGSTQMCVHTAILLRDVSTWEIELSRKWHSTKHFFFWLRWRRQRLARSRRRRILAAQSIELAVVVAQWSLTSHVAISVALHLLQGNRLERRVWTKPRSASFYQDIVPGWNDAEVSRKSR